VTEQGKMSEREIIALATIYDDIFNEGRGFPPYSRLAERCACSVSYARDTVFALAAAGYLESSDGKKPTAMTPEGEMAGARIWMDDASGKAPIPEPPEPPEPKKPKNEVAVQEAKKQEKVSLLQTMSNRLSLEPDKLLTILKTQIITVRDTDPPPTNEECALVLHTMNKYELDPMVKQIYAFRSRGKLQIVIGYDGWVRIAKKQPDYLGIEYEEGPMIAVPNGNGRKVPEWLKGKIISKGERLPTSFPVYFLEWYNPGNDSNKKRPYHHLRMKCFTQHVREHFGIAALDEQDAAVLQAPEEASFAESMQQSAARKRAEMAERLSQREKSEPENAPEVEAEDADFEDVLDQEPEPDPEPGPEPEPEMEPEPDEGGDPGPAAQPSDLFDAPAQQADPMAAIRAELARKEAERKAAK
jgi:hypothetical protein